MTSEIVQNALGTPTGEVNPLEGSRTIPNWEVVPLGAFAKAKGGFGFPLNRQGKKSGQYPFFKVSDMNLPSNGKHMIEANNWVDDEDLAVLKAKTFPAGAVVFPKIGAAILTNKKRILTRPSVIDNNLVAIVIEDQERCQSEFLYQWFQTIDLGKLANPGTVPSITSSHLHAMPVALPPITEQRRISGVLGLVQRAMEQQERLLALTAELKKAFLHQLFAHGLRHETQKQTELGPIPESWELANIGEVTTMVYRYPTYYGITYVIAGVPEIRGELLLDNGEIERDWDKFRFVTEETAGKFPKVRLEVGDIVMSVRGTMGKIGLITELLAGSVITANLIRLAPNRNKIIPEFFRWALLTPRFLQSLNAASPQTTIKTITAPNLKELKIPLPSVAEQKEIADAILSADRKEQLHRRKHAALSTLFRTLLHELMTARIRVNDLELSEITSV